MTPEIRAFEFALGLFSVLIGLSVADVAMSFHRLMRAQPVRWDPLVLLSALFAMVITVGMWFDLWGIRNATSLVTLFEIIYVAFGIHFLAGDIDRLPRAVVTIILCQWVVLVTVPAVLVLVRSRAVHYVGVVLLFATVFWHYAHQVIT